MPQEKDAPVRLVTLSEVRMLLDREQGARAELSYEQKLAMEHAHTFAKLPHDKAQELVAQLSKLGGRVSEYYAYRIADLLPTHADDVRAIFAKERSGPDNDEIEKVLATVREFQ